MLVIAGAVACGGDSHAPPIDAAPTSLLYIVVATPSEPVGRPARAEPPVVFVDGSATTDFRTTYASEADAVAADHVVELRAGSAVVASLALPGTDLASCGSGVVTSYSVQLCEYDSGDLRVFGDSAQLAAGDAGRGACAGDHGCAPECTQTTCGANRKCGAIVTSQEPLFSHLGCAPVGSAAVGSACTVAADGTDDCDAAGVCVGGTCRELCGTSCDICELVDGLPPELAVCT
jgi:hypothetical protein